MESYSRVQLKRDGIWWHREGKWSGNWRMEWVASTLHTTSEHGVSGITTADLHTLATSSRLNWRLCWFKWTCPFHRKMKSGFCARAITFQAQSTAQIRFTRSTLCSPSAKASSLAAVHCPRSTICYMLWIDVTSLSIFRDSLALYSAFSMSRTFIAVLVSPWYNPLESSISFSYNKVLAYRQPWRQRLHGSAHY